MPMTPEQRRENGRRGALKRWDGASPDERSRAAQAMVAGRTEDTKVKRLRTMADNLGYRLVPKDADGS